MCVCAFCCCCSVTKLCTTLWPHGLYSTPGLPVPDRLLEFAQVHIHWTGDVIQPSHPLLPSSPPAFNLSQHQGLFQWAACSHQVARVLELQYQSFQWAFRVCVYVYIYMPFQIPFHYTLLQNIEWSSLCYTVRPCLSVLYIIVYIYSSQPPSWSLFPFPPGNHKFAFYVCESLSVL